MSVRKICSFFTLCMVALQPSVHSAESTASASQTQSDTWYVKGKPLPPSPTLPKLLDGTEQPKFVNELVNVLGDEFIFKPGDKAKDGTDLYTIERTKFVADLGIFHGRKRLHTSLFGYSEHGQTPTYPGRTFIVNSQVPINVRWENNLVDSKGKPLPEFRYVPVDSTIHQAMPEKPRYPKSGVPAVVHLHGGFTEALSDGYPEAWTTPHFAQTGPFFKKKTFTYHNAQGSMMLWYHDHALGFTRLNNYSGLIGAYIIRDKREEQLIKKHKIPSGKYEVPLIIADKMFTTKGDLFFPYYDPESFPNEPQPSVLPEFFGDFILVNGKAWPYLNVEPREYRFRVLNGCDSRFLDLHLVLKSKKSRDLEFNQIGTDQGLLFKPQTISHLLMGPAQRADLVIDFSKYEGKTLLLTNTANAPYPGGDPVDPKSTGLIMAFNVIKKLDTDQHLTALPKQLRKNPIKRLKPTAKTRQVLLFETEDKYGRVTPLLGTPKRGGLHWDDPVTEKPRLGTTEIWEIYNTTDDAHPIHLHSGNFQIIDRQYFTGKQNPETGALSHIKLLGKPIPVDGAEKGLFDTVIVYPKDGGPKNAIGQRTRIIMKFTRPGNYVWHCHILSHEDNDMMRPMTVVKK